MKTINTFVAGAVIGILVGLWFGVNLGKDKPIFSNPFADKSIQDKIKESGEKIIQKSGEALEKGGKALKEKVQDTQ